MPDFILPEEADHCPHCGAVLRDPPNCCPAMIAEHEAELDDRLRRAKARDKNDDWPEDSGEYGDEDRLNVPY